MMIRNKLTLLFTTVVAAIMLLFAFAVYFFYAHDRQDEFRKLLHQQAVLGHREAVLAHRLAVPAGDARQAVGDVLDLDVERGGVQKIQPAAG